MIAALFVQTGGAYFGLPGVDPWDERRDAMKYRGPHPVVAHPPCSRWCRLAGLVEARWGHKRGDDGGMFAHALDCVRRFGGVLEHPAYSDAWAAFDLNRPAVGGLPQTSAADGRVTWSRGGTATRPKRPHGSTQTGPGFLRFGGGTSRTGMCGRWSRGAETT